MPADDSGGWCLPQEQIHESVEGVLQGLGIAGLSDAFGVAGEVVSEDRRSRMQRVRGRDGKDCYLKTFDYTKSRKRWRYFGQASHCRREFENLKTLRSLGIMCPQPLGWGESRVCFAPHRAFLVTEALEGFVELEKALQDGALDQGTKRAAGAVLAGQVGAMHRAGYIDRDLKFRNILIREDEGAVKLAHVDSTQGGRRAGRAFRRGVIHDLATLDKHADKYLPPLARLRFLVCYVRERGVPRSELRALLSEVAARRAELWRRDTGP